MSGSTKTAAAIVAGGGARRFGGQDKGRLVVAGRTIIVRQAGLGAIGGIYAALHAASLDQVLVVACDLPFLTAGLLARLVALSQGHDGAWVRTDRGVEPLVACYRTKARDRVAQYIDAGGRRASDLGRVLDMAELTSPDLDAFGDPARLLANINTPDDYARVQYGSA
jgi:molybdopterin-guanine dinucleotide biosynthesis protein A